MKHEPAYETCFACQGSGHGQNAYTGDPDGICWECKGDGYLRRRDALGRFVGNTHKLIKHEASL